MQDVLAWGAEVIVRFQRFSPELDATFRVLTFMGGEAFFLLVIPLIYWCMDRRVGARLSVLFLLSAYGNATAKGLFSQPRPFEIFSHVQRLAEAGGGGLPSGHTQNSVVVWAYLAWQYRRRWLWTISGLLMVLVPLSRIYLGLHFPTDVLGGYVLGLFFLVLFGRICPRVERWLGERSLRWRLAIAVLVPAVLLAIYPGGEKHGVSACALLMGMGAGFVLERCWIGFETGGSWKMKAVRFLLGEAVLFGLWIGLRTLFSDLEPETVFRFVRYILMGLWGALAAPWLFVRFRLAASCMCGQQSPALPAPKPFRTEGSQ
jgi:undecaprenyl-diphosphatase